jgi:hypothetical protein
MPWFPDFASAVELAQRLLAAVRVYDDVEPAARGKIEP